MRIGHNLMWNKRVKQAILVATFGCAMLGMSVGSGLAHPETPMDPARVQDMDEATPTTEHPIGAQAAPSVSIAAPSAAIGDFGASQGNVWDMDSTSDIVWTQTDAHGRNIQLSQPSPGIVRGRTPEGSDLAVAFYTSSSQNLPSSQYHHLIYRAYIDAEGSCATNGRVIYTKAWPNWLGSQVFTRAYSPEHVPMSCDYGNFCVYYMDLSSNDNDGRAPYYNNWFSDPPPWPIDQVRAFGIWPHELWYGAGCGGGPDYFDLDYVYLTGDIVARAKDSYQYKIKWNVEDSDGGTITSTLRYQEAAELKLPSQSPICDASNFATAWTYIGQKTTAVLPGPSYAHQIYLPIVFGSGQPGPLEFNETYDWDLSDPAFQDGFSYYVCIQVDDGTSQSYAVSTAPVIRAPLSPDFGPG